MSYVHGKYSKEEALEKIVEWAKEQIELVNNCDGVEIEIDNFVNDTAALVIRTPERSL